MANSTTKFELAFLVIWLLVAVALLVLVVLRKLKLPNFLHGNKYWSMAFAALQAVIFVLLLVALAVDSWSYASNNFGFSSFSIDYGLVRYRGNGFSRQNNCDGWTSDDKTACQTAVAAGALTLIFGLIAIFVSFALTIIVALSLFGVRQVDPAKPFVDILANVQWICMLTMVILWGVAAHDVYKQLGGTVDRLGDSWILAMVDTIFAIGSAFFFAGGAGESVKGGEASAPAQSAGPSQQV